jgi:hypothetical protein
LPGKNQKDDSKKTLPSGRAAIHGPKHLIGVGYRKLVIEYRRAVEKRSSAALRCKLHRSTYILYTPHGSFFARLASERF